MNPQKILIIEDEELIRDELKTLLSNAGYVLDCIADFGDIEPDRNRKKSSCLAQIMFYFFATVTG